MGPTMKLKRILILGSLFLIVSIQLYRYNFYRTPILTEWRQLTWDDFEGTVRPFTYWAAGINSYVDIVQDSLGTYRAIAVQNNQLSWRKAKLNNEDYVLKHEQYHFNITEYHARKLNKRLSEIDQTNPVMVKNELNKIRRETNELQFKYDREASHGSNKRQQKLWEIKIDSMLNTLGGIYDKTVDPFTNTAVDFPGVPELITSAHEDTGYPHRTYMLNRYNMGFVMLSVQNPNLSTMEEIVELRVQREGQSVLKAHYLDNYAELVFYDSSDISIDTEVCIRHYPYISMLQTTYAYDSKDTAVYARLSNEFFSSFEFVNTSSYWREKATEFQTSSLGEFFDYKEEGQSAKNEKYLMTNCSVIRDAEYFGFLSKPAISDTNLLIVGYEFVSDSIDQIDKGILSFGNNYIQSEVIDKLMLFKIDLKKYPEKSLRGLTIHYTLTGDSVEVCDQLYVNRLGIKLN